MVRQLATHYKHAEVLCPIHLGFANSQIQNTLNGCLINDAQHVTDLRVDIDCNLKFDTHINNIIGKAYARVGVITFFNF